MIRFIQKSGSSGINPTPQNVLFAGVVHLKNLWSSEKEKKVQLKVERTSWHVKPIPTCSKIKLSIKRPNNPKGTCKAKRKRSAEYVCDCENIKHSQSCWWANGMFWFIAIYSQKRGLFCLKKMQTWRRKCFIIWKVIDQIS